MSKKKKRIPYFLRNKTSCPDCGFIINSEELGKNFVCPRCKLNLSERDFWEDQYFKWSREMVEDF